MDQRTMGFGAAVGGTVLGLLVLLYGEAFSMMSLVLGGGVLALLAVGLLVWLVYSEPAAQH